ncbi:hypothetical protein NDA18_002430 [Ustilago nuda]|nr:hypothetical protein NDA18_002430 [Ustilago nuda]
MIGLHIPKAALITFLFTLGSTCAQAAPLQVTLSDDLTTCQPMKVAWDTSVGTAPWTVTVAPLGHVPLSVSLPSNYMSSKSWHWDWHIPGYTTPVSQVIVAVSDSTGRVSGTSAFSRLTKAGSCSAPPEHLDFIWYPPSFVPRQCQDWRITVQEDRGNLGLKMPVDLLILPENDVPTRLRIADQKHSSVDWMVNYARGTKFAIASFDAGTSGTGGVGGQAYTVGDARSTSCIGVTQREAVAGLPAASSTAAPVAAVTAGSALSRMATSRVTSTAMGTNAKATSTSTSAAKVDAAISGPGTSNGLIGGAVGGVFAAVLVTGLIIWFYRKQRNTRGPDEYGVYPSVEKRGFFGGFGSGCFADRVGFSGGAPNGGRFGASTDQQGGISPFVTGRSSPWRWTSRSVRLSDNQDMAQVTEDRRVTVNRMNEAGSSVGHSSSVSLHRGRNSMGGSAGGVTDLNLAPSMHSVVPDDALFPPPMSMNKAMMPSNSGSSSNFGAGVGAGVGAMGMKQNWNRDRSDFGSSMQRDPFRNPANVITPPSKETPLPSFSQEQQQYNSQPQQSPSSSQSRQHLASRDSMAAIAGLPLSPSSNYGAHRSRDLTGTIPTNNPFSNPPHIEEQILSTMRIPPPAPITTSLFDPYSHASRLYSNEEAAQLNVALNANRDERANAATPTSFTSTGSGPRYVDPKESAARFRTLETQLLNERKKVVSNVYSDLSDDEGGLPYMS